MTKIKDVFAIFKNIVLESRSEQGSSSGSLISGTNSKDSSTIKNSKIFKKGKTNNESEENHDNDNNNNKKKNNNSNDNNNNEILNNNKNEINDLKSLLTQRDKEIAILVDMVKRGVTAEEVRTSSAPLSGTNRMSNRSSNINNNENENNYDKNNNNYNNNNNNNNNNGSSTNIQNNYGEEENKKHDKDRDKNRDRERGQNLKQPVGNIGNAETFHKSSLPWDMLFIF